METKMPCYSPTLRNIKTRATPRTPKELKEKMRQDYKMKVLSCREALINKFRSSGTENDIHKTLTDIFVNTFNNSEDKINWQEEIKILDEIKNELVQEEVDWWYQEYEKSQEDVDWNLLNDETVICPICQRNNLALKDDHLKCPACRLSIKTQKSIEEVKHIIFDCIENHSSCSVDVQFTVVSEMEETHIYLICEGCNDMQLVI